MPTTTASALSQPVGGVRLRLAHPTKSIFVIASRHQTIREATKNGQAKGGTRGASCGEKEMDRAQDRGEILIAQAHQVESARRVRKAQAQLQDAAETAHRRQPSPRRGF